MSESDALNMFYRELSELYQLRSIAGLLGWDQQVLLPRQASAARADQLQLISSIIHSRFTSPAFVRMVDQLRSQDDLLGDNDRINLRETVRELERTQKLPATFVAERARANALSYSAWARARAENNFKLVEDYLKQNLELARREAEFVGYNTDIYDALLDKYEPYCSVAEIRPLFLKLVKELSIIVPQVKSKLGDVPKVDGKFSVFNQEKLNKKVAEDLGFDFDRGRLDVTLHPFASSLGPHDIRMTTRYREDNYLSSLYSTMHETGHALYEQGLPSELAGTPLAEAVSLGIHESQSRFWENIVGRSHSFSIYLHRLLDQFFPDEARRLEAHDLWRSVNSVQPSLIRVDADEVTYSIHVVIRMLLEESLIKGDLEVSELPAAWNEMYYRYLGIEVPNDSMGVLQDVHWYSGMFGYFPTYVLGNFYGAMVYDVMLDELPLFHRYVEQGDFAPLLKWLRDKIHQHGMRFTALELIGKISGESLSEQPFLNYIRTKFSL
ncbi:MAG: carboxypeptidase M32 [Bdellovibrionales bacterium]|nr:carboxypeptidase M32 [Bdellovibrionales bacterium]